MRTYEVHGDSITCQICWNTSFHPEDVRQLFCGYCNRFHEREDLMPGQPEEILTHAAMHLRDQMQEGMAAAEIWNFIRAYDVLRNALFQYSLELQRKKAWLLGRLNQTRHN